MAFCPYVMTGLRQRRRRRCRRSSYKVRQSYISRMVLPRITKFYTNFHTRRFYKRAGYVTTMYFRSEVIDVRKRDENDASDGFYLESPKFVGLHTSTPTS